MEMHVNWAAYAVAVVAQILIGILYFHPAVMGKTWANAIGADVKSMKPSNPGMTYGLTIVLTLLITMFMVINVTGPGQETDPNDGHSYVTFGHGVVHGLILTIMVIIPVFGTVALYDRKSFTWFAVQTGYWFLRLVVGLGILSAWR